MSLQDEIDATADAIAKHRRMSGDAMTVAEYDRMYGWLRMAATMHETVRLLRDGRLVARWSDTETDELPLVRFWRRDRPSVPASFTETGR